MEALTHIARLFQYPKGNFTETVEALSDCMNAYGKTVTDNFANVAFHFTSNPETYLQEYYIQTFDVNAECYLDIGYVLFGEDSKRGQFLLHLKKEQLKANNDCGTEFPDHLPNFLTLLPKLDDVVFREELIVTMFLPALRHIVKNFRTSDNIYKGLLQCLISILETNYSNSTFVPYVINKREIGCAGVYGSGMDLSQTRIKNFKM